jgi:hypothetical protein
MNHVDPQAWLAEVLARIANHPASRIDELSPWAWKSEKAASRQPHKQFPKQLLRAFHAFIRQD